MYPQSSYSKSDRSQSRDLFAKALNFFLHFHSCFSSSSSSLFFLRFKKVFFHQYSCLSSSQCQYFLQPKVFLFICPHCFSFSSPSFCSLWFCPNLPKFSRSSSQVIEHNKLRRFCIFQSMYLESSSPRKLHGNFARYFTVLTPISNRKEKLPGVQSQGWNYYSNLWVVHYAINYVTWLLMVSQIMLQFR